ncbi:hypothetical protein FEM08_23200 [Flavobacterium gilvum]|nr:hypothetical protein FEM08_23200 [Flavobacterium gilvum]
MSIYPYTLSSSMDGKLIALEGFYSDKKVKFIKTVTMMKLG